jgi:hypothetical protein
MANPPRLYIIVAVLAGATQPTIVTLHGRDAARQLVAFFERLHAHVTMLIDPA